MKTLSASEIQEINGGFWIPLLRVIAPIIVNSIVYAVNKKHHHEDPTVAGFAIAAGTGLISGGVGAATGIATGGTVAGAAAWAPGTIAINASGNLIAKEY